MKVTPRLIIAAATAVAAAARLFATAQASNMPPVERRKAQVLPLPVKRRKSDK